MTYIDAYHDRMDDIIYVVERNDGEHVEFTVKPNYVFYWPHDQGAYTSIYGDKCHRELDHNYKRFRTNLDKKRAAVEARGVRKDRCIFESDINPVFRYFAEHYKEVSLPALNIGFFDIEADFDQKRGFAPPENPFNAVTAISLLKSETQRLHCLALRPKATFTREDADKLEAETSDLEIFEHEADLLARFLDLISDCSILSGWNSEQYDIPYLINRIRIVLGEDAIKRLCRWGVEPRGREYEKFGKKFQTYELIGRPHLDYLLLYQKHNTQQQHSYRLDFIGEIETGENKVPYDGTLDALYRFDFPKFIAYSRQDVALLGKIDAKRKFIDLANQIAHANRVTFKATMGSVTLIEQAIINEMHAMGFIVPDRKVRGDDASVVTDDFTPDDDDDDDETEEQPAKRFSMRALKDTGRIPVVGAYVAKPIVGLHDHVAACDINSLYPSAIRALNMSPETVFGQIRPDATQALIKQRISEGTPRAEAWEGLFAIIEVTKMHERDPDFMLTVVWEDPDHGQSTMSAAELYDLIFSPDSHMLITANGTIFRTDKEGIIPHLLKNWYAERKQQQRIAKQYKELRSGITVPPDLLDSLIQALKKERVA